MFSSMFLAGLDVLSPGGHRENAIVSNRLMVENHNEEDAVLERAARSQDVEMECLKLYLRERRPL